MSTSDVGSYDCVSNNQNKSVRVTSVTITLKEHSYNYQVKNSCKKNYLKILFAIFLFKKVINFFRYYLQIF